MTDRKLMQMALLKMEYMLNNGEWYKPEETIEALRARLAQPEPDDGYCQACDGDSCTAKEGCVARDNPPPQREWQGLTDEEVIKLGRLDKDSDYFGLWYDFAQAIEAKLKEKNCG